MYRYIGLLLLIPLLDALGLVVAAGFLGWQLVVLLVVLTGLVGMLLVRAEGRYTLKRIQRKLAQGDPPTNELLDGGLLIAAAAFLLTPGLVTDTLGFLFVIPLTRYPIRVALKKFVIVPYLDRKTDGLTTGNIYIGGFPDEDDFDDGNVRDGDYPSDDPDDGFGAGEVRDVDYTEVDGQE